MSDVLVTDAAGGIGSAVARSLGSKGHRVIALHRDAAALERLSQAGVRTVAADLRFPDRLRTAISGIDHLVS
ncbi:MAG TPA: SDR family NAD(P)-dependent oxidoreductase [Streptosporangiaceae bacterium]|jgi:uncharacterized protein YbjT (DUF2867 family)|nr:SDR family NAD(P)-dependent oxidoreductase [Streptosporangiaceae bacterium]